MADHPPCGLDRACYPRPDSRAIAGRRLGLVLGLVVSALAALPLSYLPSPFRGILPTIVAIVFGYLGIMVMVSPAEGSLCPVSAGDRRAHASGSTDRSF